MANSGTGLNLPRLTVSTRGIRISEIRLRCASGAGTILGLIASIAYVLSSSQRCPQLSVHPGTIPWIVTRLNGETLGGGGRIAVLRPLSSKKDGHRPCRDVGLKQTQDCKVDLKTLRSGIEGPRAPICLRFTAGPI